MSSLEPKDAIADYSELNEAQMKTLNQWDTFFEKVCLRYLKQIPVVSADALFRGIIL